METKKIISSEFARRKARNPRYSIRAFARDLGMSPGATSDLLKGKRRLTKKGIHKLMRATGLPATVYEKMLATKSADEILDLKKFELISGWEHFAILNLTKLTNFKSDPQWIAKKLNLPKARVKKAIGRLEALKLIAVEPSGNFRRTSERLATPTSVASAALREAHLEELEQIKQAIVHGDFAKRDITSLTVPVNPTKLAEAKKIIWEFHQKLSDCLEDGDCSEVYTAVFALYPVTA